jgi:hypothetical protein
VNEILLSNEVIVYLLSETVLYLLLFIAFISTLGLLRKWNFDAFTTEQFALENRSYLVMTIIFFVMLLKVVLLPYFVYTIDNLSDLIPGAMCGAGVVKANEYGNPLLSLKIIILFLSGLWLSMNSIDLKAKSYPYLKYFTHIETTNPVSCCSVIFGQTGGANGLPFGLDIPKLLILFYLLFALVVLTTVSDLAVMSIIASLLFGVIAYYAVVYFFGTYIYELPTHQCPFCMLQDHYYYVGYLLWGLLMLGVYYFKNGVLL